MKLLLLFGIAVCGCRQASSYIIEQGPAIKASNREVWPKPFEQSKFNAFSILFAGSVAFNVKGNTCGILNTAIARYSLIIENQSKYHKMEPVVSNHQHRKSSLFKGDFSSIDLNLTKVCDDKIATNMIESCTYYTFSLE